MAQQRKLTSAEEGAILEELRVRIGGFPGEYSREHGLDMDEVSRVLTQFCQERFCSGRGWKPPDKQ